MESTTQEPAISGLAAAFVAAVGELDNVTKNAMNPHFGSNYADLGAVLDTVRPVFAKHGLALLIAPGEIDGDKLNVTGLLLHKSGQTINMRMHIPVGKATAQGVGSAITYARRYITASVAGIAQTDDDGNAASSSEETPRRAKGASKATATTTEPTYAATAEALIGKIAAAGTLKELEAVKPEVAELGDTKVAEAYVARKNAIKAAK